MDAARILELVRREGLRFRDIGVVARSYRTIRIWMESVFARYGVPVFSSSMSEILDKPILALVTGALDTVAGGYVYDDVFRYLKDRPHRPRGGGPGSAGELCLEVGHPGEPVDAGEALDHAPQGLWLPHDGGGPGPVGAGGPGPAAGGGPAGEAAEKFGPYRTWTGYGSLRLSGGDRPAPAAGRAGGGTAPAGEPALAEEYRQLWEILCGGLEQCAALTGEVPMELEEFSSLFQLVLSQYDVGTIPSPWTG